EPRIGRTRGSRPFLRQGHVHFAGLFGLLADLCLDGRLDQLDQAARSRISDATRLDDIWPHAYAAPEWCGLWLGADGRFRCCHVDAASFAQDSPDRCALRHHGRDLVEHWPGYRSDMYRDGYHRRYGMAGNALAG